MPNVLLFWIAFVLTRPLGATAGDFLTKPLAKGGLDLGTAGSLVVCSVRRCQRAGPGHPAGRLTTNPAPGAYSAL
ncbi:hypothetical protein ACH4SK_27785 [Streptomyces inhibens]|uniref:hypothetical protein n=1 Tax=Streptomyces inhibens TaxID=2293571 RepID=UPI00378EE674